MPKEHGSMPNPFSLARGLAVTGAAARGPISIA